MPVTPPAGDDDGPRATWFRRGIAAAMLWVLPALPAAARGADWPTYQHDNARSGVTAERLAPEISQHWVFRPAHPPEPGWSDPQPVPIGNVMEYPRVRFDDAFHVAAVGDAIYFGSSSENTIYCLAAASGQVRWRAFTEGAVRLAPTVRDGRVYVGSDDGCVYCLSADDGAVAWKFRAGPGAGRVLGRGKVVSMWPVRTGVLVEDGVAYFGAGLFPGEGLYFHALDARTGKEVWRNDTTGRGGLAGLSPQGYMLCSDERLYVASGRAGPALLDRKTGQFLTHSSLVWRKAGLFGGAFAVLAGDHLFSGTQHIVAYSGPKLTAGHAWIPGRRLVVTPDRFFVLTGSQLAAYDAKTYPAVSRKEQTLVPKKFAQAGLHAKLKTLHADLAGAEVLRKRAQWALDAISPGAPGSPDAQAGLDAAKKALAAADAKVASAQRNIRAAEKQIQTFLDDADAVADAIRETTAWRVPCEHTDSMILAASTLYVGGEGEVLAVRGDSGEQIGRYKVQGKARGLAAVNGRLLVSTDTGAIYCFAAGAPATEAPAAGAGSQGAPSAAEARVMKLVTRDLPAIEKGITHWEHRKFFQDLSVRRGYALLLGGTAPLADVLAERPEMMVQVALQDPAAVRAAQADLARRKLLGARVGVDCVALGKLPYPNYFANLVVCEAMDASGKGPATPADELVRVLKPLGGVAYVHVPQDDRAKWLAAVKKHPSIEVTAIDTKWVRLTRGVLPGAGSWTHEYGEPGNTACGDDQLITGPLGLLWYGEPGPTRTPSRHGSAPAPLALDGRVFVQLEDALAAYDAYNAVLLWETPIRYAGRERMGSMGTKGNVSNLAARGDSLFVAIGPKCLRLDTATGQIRQTYEISQAADEETRSWGYLAVVKDVLIGSRTEDGRNADCVFAVDIDSGRRKWDYTGEGVLHISIAAGGGRLYLVDRNVTPEQRRRAAAAGTAAAPSGSDLRGRPRTPDVRLVVALDLATGRPVWQVPVDVTDCVKIGKSGGELTTMYSHEVLLLCGQPWNGHFWREFLAGQFSRRSIIALSAGDGHVLWSGHKGYRSRPLVVGETIYAEPWAYDLYTGKPKMRVHPVTGREEKWQMSRPGHHCGCIAAAPSYLFFRSGATGYYDLQADEGTAHYGAVRPGCWINFIPANGLVLMPEAASGCVCPFPIQTSVVLAPRRQDRAWYVFSAPGPMTPVKRLAINFGAPGDRHAPDGALWLGFPRPYTGRLVMDPKLAVKLLSGGDYYRHSAENTPVAGTDTPWVYTYGVAGLSACTVQLLDRKDPGGALYTVRLHFAEPVHPAPGKRVFGVKLMDKLVADKLDVAAEAGGRNKALVKEFKDIPVATDLKIELVGAAEKPALNQMPILSAIEVIRTKEVPSMPKPPEPKPAKKPAKK